MQQTSENPPKLNPEQRKQCLGDTMLMLRKTKWQQSSVQIKTLLCVINREKVQWQQKQRQQLDIMEQCTKAEPKATIPLSMSKCCLFFNATYYIQIFYSTSPLGFQIGVLNSNSESEFFLRYLKYNFILIQNKKEWEWQKQDSTSQYVMWLQKSYIWNSKKKQLFWNT